MKGRALARASGHKTSHLLGRLQQQVTRIMASDETGPPLSFNSLLAGFSRAYGLAVAHRARRFASGRLAAHKLPCKVVAVGNITTGGTGKTPMTIFMARLIREMGFSVAVISRGYGGRAETSGAVVSDGRRLLVTADVSGDEPWLMAHHLDGIPVVVGRNRYQAGLLALRRFGADVIVLDDAFQHLALRRDVNLALLDARRPFGNTFLLPRGTLREPVTSLARADAIVLTRMGDTMPAYYSRLEQAFSHRPIFGANHRIHVSALESLRSLSRAGFRYTHNAGNGTAGLPATVFAFSGLADNSQFFDALEGLGWTVAGCRGFGDHHPYTRRDISAVVRAARDTGAACLATTEKDAARLPAGVQEDMQLAVIGLEMVFYPDAAPFSRFIGNCLGRPVSASTL